MTVGTRRVQRHELVGRNAQRLIVGCLADWLAGRFARAVEPSKAGFRARHTRPVHEEAFVRNREHTAEKPRIVVSAFRDRHGLESLERVGVDNITFETDYPHTDSTWPDTKRVATEMMGHLPDDVVYKIVRGNAIKMLSLEAR